MPAFDSAAAWKSASAMVAANREVLAALAGVFFLLPGLLGAVVLPRPALAEGMNEQQMADALVRFYIAAGPVAMLLSLPFAIGLMTMMVVMLDRTRPTVGAAIMQSVRLFPSYLAAYLLSTLAMTGALMAVLLVLALLLPAVLAVLFTFAAMVWPMARLLLLLPEIAVRRERNPLTAIRASLSATRGRVLAIVLFFGPAIALFIVVNSLILMVAGVVLDRVLPVEPRELVSDGAAALLMAAGYTYLAAMIAATWRQLAADPDAPGALQG